MNNKKITFRLLAYSDAAGKYNPNAPLNGNEDNFYIDDDISDEIPGRCQMDKDIIMSDCGCLMVVADGMGGMNAGEVASEIAINTVKDLFSPGRVSSKIAESPIERRKYLEHTIREADKRIKNDANTNPEHEGMGSTIIMAWIVGDKMTISWCGDSRAYRFNPINGIELLSRDHSYVQELVNRGDLTYEDTFEHPQGNIVTRSLGDPNNTAKPETREFNIFDEDIILLCSDGLSGVLRDKKAKDHNGNYYPGETIEDIIYANCGSLTQCKDALMSAAERADWYDNVTVLLCQIKKGALPAKIMVPQQNKNDVKNINNRKLILTVAIAGISVGTFIGYMGTSSIYKYRAKKSSVPTEQCDSLQVEETYGSINISDEVKLDASPKEETSKSQKSIVSEPKATSKNVNERDLDIENWKKKQLEIIKSIHCQNDINWLKNYAVDAVGRVKNANDEKGKSWVISLIKQIETRSAYINRLLALNDKVTTMPYNMQEEYKRIYVILLSCRPGSGKNQISNDDLSNIDSTISKIEDFIKKYKPEITEVEVTPADNYDVEHIADDYSNIKDVNRR